MVSPTGEQIPIRAVASLTGVNAVTLRAWERRYGLIRPLRTPKGHRLYTHQHVDRIHRVLALLERGVPVSRVREALDAESKHRVDGGVRGPWHDYIDRMAAAIARFDELELDHVYDEALSIHSIDNITRQMILPLLKHLGERWNQISGGVAEEHFFAAYLRTKLGARLQHRMRYAIGPRLVAACAPGEQHEIGLLLFALEAHNAGLRTVLLGADTPFEQVAIALRRSGGQGIVISSCVDPEPGLFEHALSPLVRQAGVPVFIGGAAAARHRQAIVAAGAVALGVDIEDGVRLIAAALNSKEADS